MYSWQHALNKKRKKELINKIITTKNTKINKKKLQNINEILSNDILKDKNYIIIIAKINNKLILETLFKYKTSYNNTNINIISKYNPFPLKSSIKKKLLKIFNSYINNNKYIIYDTELKKIITNTWWLKYYLKSKWSHNNAYIELKHNIKNGIYKFNQTKQKSLKKYHYLTEYKYLKKSKIIFLKNKIITMQKIFNYKKNLKPWFIKMIKFISNNFN